MFLTIKGERMDFLTFLIFLGIGNYLTNYMNINLAELFANYITVHDISVLNKLHFKIILDCTIGTIILALIYIAFFPELGIWGCILASILVSSVVEGVAIYKYIKLTYAIDRLELKTDEDVDKFLDENLEEDE